MTIVSHCSTCTLRKQQVRAREPRERSSLFVLLLFFCQRSLNAYGCLTNQRSRRRWEFPIRIGTAVTRTKVTTCTESVIASVTCAKTLGSMGYISAFLVTTGAAVHRKLESEKCSCCRFEFKVNHDIWSGSVWSSDTHDSVLVRNKTKWTVILDFIESHHGDP